MPELWTHLGLVYLGGSAGNPVPTVPSSERHRNGSSTQGGAPLKVVKSISLNEETAPLANSKVNFSAWVRKKLLDEESVRRRKSPEVFDENSHVAFRESLGVCWPFHSSGCCPNCWPDGPPTEADWRKFMHPEDFGGFNREFEKPPLPGGQGWLSDEEEAILLASKDENASNTPPLRRRYVRRTLAWLWEWI